MPKASSTKQLKLKARSRKQRAQHPRGILIVEVIMAIAIFAIFASGAVYFLTANLLSAQAAQWRNQATVYLQEGMEAVQSIDRYAWNELADSPDSEYGLELSGSVWTLVAEPDNPQADTRFTRTITIEDVYRNTAGDIVDNTDTEAVFDPHTRAITTTITWDANNAGRTSSISAPAYVTDWDDAELISDLTTDWSAGTLDNLRISDIDDGELQVIQPTMELGTVTATTTTQTVLLSNEYTQAVVITSILDGGNPNSPVSTRVSNVTSTSFDLRLQFPTDNFAPSSTNSETVYYLVIEAGKWTLGDGATKLEAGIVEDVSRVNCSTCGSWNNGTDITYQHTYTATPLVFHQVITENDTDWITSFVSDDTNAAATPGTDGFQVALNGAESTTAHDPEDIGYLVIEQEKQDSFEGVNFETDATGRTMRGQSDARRRENFDQTYGTAPFALVTQMSMRVTDGSWSMLDAITTTQITIYEDEDQTLDTERSHLPEYGGYIAFASTGTYYLDDAAVAYDEPPMEVGIIAGADTGFMEVGTTTASSSWSTVTLTNTYTEPVVVVSILDGNNPNSPVATRVKNASGNSFEVRLDFPTDNFAPRSTNSETVYYMVVEAGVWLMGDGKTKVEAGIVEDVSRVNCFTCGSWNNGTQVVHTSGYTANPTFLHQVMSENSASWISSFASNSTDYRSSPGVNGFRVALNGASVTNAHAAEDIGYIVMETDKADTANGIAYETDTTGISVRGYDDARYSEAFSQTYTTAPLVLVSQLSMRGTEGAWAMIDSITTTTLTMYEDEDQTSDRERSHQAEYYAYAAFASAGSFTLTDQTFLQSPVTVDLVNSYVEPVVITTPYFTNDTNSPASVRVYDVTSDSFTAKLDFPTDNYNPVNTSYSNDVYYMVMEAGDWQMGDMKIEAHVQSISTIGSFANGWTGTSVNFDHDYTQPPVVLHQVMSNNDTDWITSFVSRSGDRTNVPTVNSMYLGLNAAEVATSNVHDAEDIGWIAFENVGTETHEGIELRTYKNSEFAFAHTNGCYSYTHGGTYTTPIVLLSQMSMDGTEGSWASICNVSSTSVSAHVEEDQYRDSERSHTDEAVGMLIFQETFDSPGEVNTSKLISGTFESPVLGDSTLYRNFNIAEWIEQVDCTSCDVAVQVRTGGSTAAVATATYVGPDGTADTSFSDGAGDLLSLVHLTHPYIQYFVTMEGTTAESPILEDVTLSVYEN